MRSEPTAGTGSRLWILAMSVATPLLGLFAAFQIWGPTALSQPATWLDSSSAYVAMA